MNLEMILQKIPWFVLPILLFIIGVVSIVYIVKHYKETGEFSLRIRHILLLAFLVIAPFGAFLQYFEVVDTPFFEQFIDAFYREEDVDSLDPGAAGEDFHRTLSESLNVHR